MSNDIEDKLYEGLKATLGCGRVRFVSKAEMRQWLLNAIPDEPDATEIVDRVIRRLETNGKDQ